MSTERRTAFHTQTTIIQETGHSIITTNDPNVVIRYAQAVAVHPRESKCLTAVFTFPSDWIAFEAERNPCPDPNEVKIYD